MGMTAEQYLSQLQALLPSGAAWPRDADATLTELLQAFADELARVDGRSLGLIEEADPRTTSELLADWERVAGLPDSCVGVDQTTAQRRSALVNRLTTLGGQSAAYYIAVAASIGYTITITEYRQFQAGASVAGDTLTNGEWNFAWRVNAPLISPAIPFTAGSGSAGDPLSAWGNEALECVINRLKPAHTYAIFAYQ